MFHSSVVVTVKEAVLVAVPPGVAIVIFPVTAPVGTTAVTPVSEFTVKLVERTPPNATRVAPVKLVPVIVTEVPTGPLVGENDLIAGITRNFTLLVRMPVAVLTVTTPPVAPLGTVAVKKVSELIVKLDGFPLKVTDVVPFKPWPRIPIDVPTLAALVTNPAYALRLALRLKNTPAPALPPP